MGIMLVHTKYVLSVVFKENKAQKDELTFLICQELIC